MGGENHELESLQTMQIRHGDPSDHTPFGLLNLVFRGLTLGTFSLLDNKKMKSFEKNRCSEFFFCVFSYFSMLFFFGVVNLQKNMYQKIFSEDTGCLFAPDFLDTVSFQMLMQYLYTSKGQIFIL